MKLSDLRNQIYIDFNEFILAQHFLLLLASLYQALTVLLFGFSEDDLIPLHLVNDPADKNANVCYGSFSTVD